MYARTAAVANNRRSNSLNGISVNLARMMWEQVAAERDDLFDDMARGEINSRSINQAAKRLKKLNQELHTLTRIIAKG